MMGGTTSGTSNTTTQTLTPDQQSLADLAQPDYQQFAASTQTAPTADQSVAPFNANQIQGQNTVLGTTGTQTGVVSGAANANNLETSGSLLDPSSNPALAAYQSSAVQPIYDNLNQTTLPQLSANTATSGSGGVSANVGGSREGIAQGIATEGANQAAGQTEASIANSGYNAGLSALNAGVNSAPTTAAAQTIPGATQSTVGDVQQQQTQSVDNANVAADQFAQWLPLIKAQLLTQGAASTPGGSTTSTGTGNTSANPVSQIIGGASAAGGLAGGLAKLLPLLAA